MLDFTGKVAIVTGSGRGIGEAIALTLARQGADVAVVDIRSDEASKTVSAIKGLGRRAIAIKADVSQKEEVDQMARTVLDSWGQIDILVNNAGWDKIEPFVQNTPEFWEKIIGINYKGIIYCTRAVLEHMIERKAGKIVNIGSDAGRVGSMGEAVYSGCKGGIIAFTKTIAREMARYNINANCVCPGITETPLIVDEVMKDKFGGRVVEAIVNTIPLRRMGKPQDVANAVVFLASTEALYITGQTLSVNGGLAMC